MIKYLLCSATDVNVTPGQDIAVVCGANETVAIDCVEYGEDGMLLLGMIIVGEDFVQFVCFNLSSVVFDKKSRKHTKPVFIRGFTMNEPSDNGKNMFVFNIFKSLSSILRFKTSHGSFVNKKAWNRIDFLYF